jgi:cell division protease FtsH
MVTEWGMSPLGPVAYGQEDQPIFLGKEIARHKDYSEEKARQIDDAIHTILSDSFGEAKRILTEHRDELEKLTTALVEKETLVDAEVRDLLGLPERKSLIDLRDEDPEAPEQDDEA